MFLHLILIVVYCCISVEKMTTTLDWPFHMVGFDNDVGVIQTGPWGRIMVRHGEKTFL